MCSSGGISATLQTRGWKSGSMLIGGAIGVLALGLIAVVATVCALALHRQHT